ncbi:transposable element Tcb1 transposase [Trichonephila clavipes]|nr:transposable element Tcb1 transposase [Trichonephila clavipes]
MTVRIYRDVILEQHVLMFRGAMGSEFLFLDDNARPHRANIVDECLQSEDITCMDWPAYSPGSNRIEHVWDMLDQRIAARQPPTTCIPELRRALLDEWCNISQDLIANLILSMPRRCKLAGGAYRLLSLRDNHRETRPNIHTDLAGGAKRPLSSRVNHRIPWHGTHAGALPRISPRCHLEFQNGSRFRYRTVIKLLAVMY